MSEPRTWSYAEITQEAEAAIRSAMELARQHQASESTMARCYQMLAYGKYSLWASITAGWQESGDGERLHALTEPQASDPLEAPELSRPQDV